MMSLSYVFDSLLINRRPVGGNSYFQLSSQEIEYKRGIVCQKGRNEIELTKAEEEIKEQKRNFHE